MKEYLFIFGRTPKLAKAELKSILKRFSIPYAFINVDKNYALLQINSAFDEKIFDIFGGLVKVAQIFSKSSKRELVKEIHTELLKEIIPEKKIVFGISFYYPEDKNWIKQFHAEIKDKFCEKKIKSRFIIGDKGIIAPVILKKQNLKEIIVVKLKRDYILAKTIFIHDFEDWSKRDFARPIADPKRGMLPPKIARIMLNLALQDKQDLKEEFCFLDPFCGVGTVLAEGMMLNCKVIGSDISSKSVNFTKKNILWLMEEYQLKSAQDFYVSDAQEISIYIPKNSLDAVVTEPYMGPNFTSKQDKTVILALINKLDKLYYQCFIDWYRLLKVDGKVVIIFPCFQTQGGGQLCVKRIVDTCENIGYTLMVGPYEYAREKAVLRRQIYIFKKRR